MTPPSSDSLPRKAPQQERGRAAVAGIRAAAREILEESGFEGLTTLSIAERAGVNVATLYRYYPNKFAIIRDIAELVEEERSRVSLEALSSLGTDANWRTLVHTTLESVIALRRSQPAARAIRRALHSTPELWELDTRILKQMAEQLAPFVARASSHSASGALSLPRARHISLIVVSTVTNVLDLTDDSEEDSQSLHAELSLLLERYLAPIFDGTTIASPETTYRARGQK